MDPMIVTVATTGSRTTKEQNPDTPITPEEIANQAVACWRAGAAIVHVHVRRPDGVVTCDPALYQEVRERIRAAGSDIIINMSTGGGAGVTTDEERMQPVALRPEIASFDCGSTNFGEGVFINSPKFLRELARRMRENGVRPEIECFDTGMIQNALDLVREGHLAEPLLFQFVLGVKGAAPPTVKELLHMTECIPPGTPWSVCAIGRGQLPMNVAAMIMGGHPRTGMEDNIYYRRGEKVTGNAQLVERVVRIGKEYGREPATPTEARRILGLPEWDGRR